MSAPVQSWQGHAQDIAGKIISAALQRMKDPETLILLDSVPIEAWGCAKNLREDVDHIKMAIRHGIPDALDGLIDSEQYSYEADPWALGEYCDSMTKLWNAFHASTRTLPREKLEENLPQANPPEKLREGSRPDVDPLGELANAYRFKAISAGKIMNCPARGWVVYGDGFWQPGEREAIKTASGLGAVIRDEGHAATDDPDLIKAYYSAARRAESARGVEATLKLAKALPGVDATGIAWDSDEWLVNVKNGTVDVRTLTLMPHEQSDYFTRCIPFEFHQDATCQVWEEHLHKVTNGNPKLIRYLQFLFGYSITASMKHQLFVICHGKAGCAKSTTIEAGMYPMGPYADAVSHDVVLDQHHAGHACTLAALCGLRFGLVSELPEGARWNEAQVKRLATGDTLAARLIGQNPFSFKSTMKLWVNCNARPEFRDSGGGMARRIRCVPFVVDMTGEGRDLNIEEKLRNEAPGILRWILEGAQMAYEGEPEIPEEVKVSSREYVRQNDVLANFLDECCIVEQGSRAEVGPTYDAFRLWGGDLSKRKLGILLGTKYDQYNDGKARYWIGFRLK